MTWCCFSGKGLTPFDLLKRYMVPRRATRRPKGVLEEAGSSAERAEAHDPVAAFVTPHDGGDRGRTTALLKPSTIGLFREARRHDLAISRDATILARRHDLASHSSS